MSLRRPSIYKALPRPAGFTLIELLVATAVMAVVLTLLVQVVQYVGRAARNGQEASEVFSSARAVLDTVGRDLENAVMRDDLASFADATSRNGTLAFYARVPGMAASNQDPAQIRRLSLVRYDHDTNGTGTNIPSLLRADLGITWAETNLISFGTTNSLPQLPGVTARRLCEGVLGFDVVYVLQNGTLTRDPSSVASPVRAVRLTLALVDPEAAHLLGQASLNQRFLDLFAVVPALPESTKTAWALSLENPAVWTGVPEQVRRRMKVYERVITLPKS